MGGEWTDRARGRVKVRGARGNFLADAFGCQWTWWERGRPTRSGCLSVRSGCAGGWSSSHRRASGRTSRGATWGCGSGSWDRRSRWGRGRRGAWARRSGRRHQRGRPSQAAEVGFTAHATAAETLARGADRGPRPRWATSADPAPDPPASTGRRPLLPTGPLSTVPLN